jgi:hypothetical protein
MLFNHGNGSLIVTIGIISLASTSLSLEALWCSLYSWSPGGVCLPLMIVAVVINQKKRSLGSRDNPDMCDEEQRKYSCESSVGVTKKNNTNKHIANKTRQYKTTRHDTENPHSWYPHSPKVRTMELAIVLPRICTHIFVVDRAYDNSGLGVPTIGSFLS